MTATCELMERLLRLLRLPLLWLDRSLKAPLFPFWPPKVGAPLLSLEYLLHNIVVRNGQNTKWDELLFCPKNMQDIHLPGKSNGKCTLDSCHYYVKR